MPTKLIIRNPRLRQDLRKLQCHSRYILIPSRLEITPRQHLLQPFPSEISLPNQCFPIIHREIRLLIGSTPFQPSLLRELKNLLILIRMPLQIFLERQGILHRETKLLALLHSFQRWSNHMLIPKLYTGSRIIHPSDILMARIYNE